MPEKKEDIMQNVYEKLISCYESIREKIPFTPRVALVLGSGPVSYTHLDVYKRQVVFIRKHKTNRSEKRMQRRYSVL